MREGVSVWGGVWVKWVVGPRRARCEDMIEDDRVGGVWGRQKPAGSGQVRLDGGSGTKAGLVFAGAWIGCGWPKVW